MKKIIFLALALILVFGMCACKAEECEHIDKDDNFLCDKCDADFDDGLEVVTANVTFEFKNEAGAPMSGVKFFVSGNGGSFTLVTAADGTAKQELIAGKKYDITYDYSTIPSGFQPNVSVLSVAKDTSKVSVTVVDNNPNGSAERPYHIAEDLTETTIPAGAEVFYTCRVSNYRKMMITGDGIVAKYNGVEYASGQEFVIVNDSSNTANGNVNILATFSLKNTSNADIDVTIETIFDPGTQENPYMFDVMSKEVALEKNQGAVYYAWVATEDGELVISSTNSRISVSAQKVSEDDIPITSEMDEDGNQRIVVLAGEKIFITISNASSSNQTATISLTINTDAQ